MPIPKTDRLYLNSLEEIARHRHLTKDELSFVRCTLLSSLMPEWDTPDEYYARFIRQYSNLLPSSFYICPNYHRLEADIYSSIHKSILRDYPEITRRASLLQRSHRIMELEEEVNRLKSELQELNVPDPFDKDTFFETVLKTIQSLR